MDNEIHNYSFQMKLSGDSEISATTLCDVLSNLILVANKTKPDEAALVQYNVKATTPGSFVIDLHAIAAVAHQLIIGNGEIINVAKTSVQTIVELLKLKSFLKGEKPKSVEEKNGCVEVTNNEGTINNFYIVGDYINNQTIDKGLIGIANALYKGDIPNFSIIDTNSENSYSLFNIKKEEYPYIQHPMADADREEIYESITDVNFTVKKADLQGNSQWEIILDKRVVKASIEDEEWLQKVKLGQVSVNAQKVLKAKIRTTCRLDKYKLPVKDTFKYYILQVYSYNITEDFPQIEIQDSKLK